MLKRCINKIKEWWHRDVKKHHVTKKSKLDKDVVLGKIRKEVARNIKVGVKVIGPEGMGSIKEIINTNWVMISYQHKIKDGKNSIATRNVQDKPSYLCQYYIEIFDRLNNTSTTLPLSYSDYQYIAPDEDQEDDGWVEGHITNLKYFKLTDAEKEQRIKVSIFNRYQGGKHILRQLEDKECTVKFIKGKLLIKSN